MRKFLTARWQDLIMVNYEIDPVLLGTRPAGTELDLEDGKCFVSLVGFMFLGLGSWDSIPFHVNFEEVNLLLPQTQVEGETRRAVCFIKEIVPLGDRGRRPNNVRRALREVEHENSVTARVWNMAGPEKA
jgi:hypothetical protein